jgi:hypothetical protein
MTSTMTIDQNGNKEWRNPQGQRHRIDGPAVEYADGTKVWWLNDQLHRTDGPAVEWANGRKVWYLNGQPHRTLGPAVEWANGTKQWYLNGQELTFDQWVVQVPVTEQARTLLLLKYGVITA